MARGMSHDRTVHAETDAIEVVRYDRAGKWYLEPRDKRLPRQHVKIADAVKYAVWAAANEGGRINFGVSGGSTFDSMIHDAVAEGRSI